MVSLIVLQFQYNLQFATLYIEIFILVSSGHHLYHEYLGVTLFNSSCAGASSPK